MRLLLDYLRSEYPFRFSVVVADDASTDGTAAMGSRLAALEPQFSFLRLERKGRGLVLRTAWLASEADVVSYMGVDLSTDLTSFPPLVAPLLSGHSEVAIGTRLAHSSHVRRRVKRGVLFPWLQPAAGRIAATAVAIPPVTVGSFLANRPWTFADEH